MTEEGYQNYDVNTAQLDAAIAAAIAALPPSGGLLSSVANFFNNANQAFTTPAVAVDFQSGRFFPGAGPFEVLVANDDEFTPQVDDAVWRIAWKLTAGNTGGTSATLQSWLEINSVQVDGTLSTLNLPPGENSSMSGEAYVAFTNAPVDTFQLMVERIAGTGTPQVSQDQALLTVERVTESGVT